MAGKLITPDLAAVLAARSIPGLVLSNRLEGRPRAEAFDRALRAEVRDALWMLTRQWQLGEFRGDDAGSPITAKVRVDTAALDGYRGGDGPDEPFDDGTPLETVVERLPAPFTSAGVEAALDLRLLMGRYWLRLVAYLGATVRSAYLLVYPVHRPDPDDPADAPICAHPQAWSAYQAAAGRLMDGAKLYQHLIGGGSASDGIAGADAAVDALGERFVAWFDRLIASPRSGGNAAFQPPRLEYRFSATAAQRTLVAEEYDQGRLDWYSVDASAPTPGAPEPPAGPTEKHVFTMLPTAVTFNGMPNTRWWSFEDGQTNFGDIRPDTTDLAKLLLIEFGLVYANDWFLVPFTVPAGRLATVRGVAVTNVFGERTWVRAASSDPARWSLFTLSEAGQPRQPVDLGLAILPTAAKVLDGPPVDEVLVARDELANLVWGIEKAIPLPSGAPAHGAEAAYETLAYFTADYVRRNGHEPTPPPGAEGAHIRYRVMTTVPENWIPFIPVHLDGDVRETQLQRASMPRTFDGDTAPPTPVHPRTWLLRQGLDGGAQQPYFLYEEEVSRAGVRVTRAFRRTRWRDGRVWVWLGARKQTGRGEGSSGLAFDGLLDLP